MNGAELKQWRQAWKVTQDQLGRMLGTHRVTIAQWETGRRGIPSFLPLALEALEHRLTKGDQDGLISGMSRVQKAE